MEQFYKSFLENHEERLWRLLKHATLHAVVVASAFFLFFVTTHLLNLDTRGVKHGLAIFSAIFLGTASTAIFHEWSHLIGAKLGGATYTIPRKLGVFIFEWNFAKNSITQFYIMSVAGSVGGLLTIFLLNGMLPEFSMKYNKTVLASAFSAFVLGAVIEWPVLFRTFSSKNPYAELEKTTPKILIASLVIAIFSGIVAFQVVELFA